MNELNIKYPTHVAFTLIRNIKTGEQRVIASNHGAKGTVENKKYGSINHFTWNDDETTALIDYVRFENEEEFKATLEVRTEQWAQDGNEVHLYES